MTVVKRLEHCTPHRELRMFSALMASEITERLFQSSCCDDLVRGRPRAAKRFTV
jgi:hypothetical protein